MANISENEPLLAWARARWPQPFTKREASEALGVNIKRIQGVSGMMHTGVYRYENGRRRVLWRYSPYQMRLPLGDER